jgi:hypothetical protein
MSASKIIKRERIHTIVVNTNPHMYGRETYGHIVPEVMASIMNGSHHPIGTLGIRAEMVENMIGRIREDQRGYSS